VLARLAFPLPLNVVPELLRGIAEGAEAAGYTNICLDSNDQGAIVASPPNPSRCRCTEYDHDRDTADGCYCGHRHAQQDKATRPVWASYSGKPVACHKCSLNRYEAHRAAGLQLPAPDAGPLPHAKRVRTIKATGERLHLCKQCAEPMEAADKQANP
jgi:hypothetical protein